MPFDFSDLSTAQKNLLTFDGWQPGSAFTKQPTAKTAKKMVDRGLLIEIKRSHNGLSWIEYAVPVAVHMEWCDHCSRQHFGEVP